MRFLKFTAASLATFTMVMAPVAQGAEAKKVAKEVAKAQAKPHAKSDLNYNVDKVAMQDFLKYTGLNGKRPITVGEYHQKMRQFYPRTLRTQMDEWARVNRSEIMPQVDITGYKDGEGKERVRMILNTKEGQTVSASYNPDSNGKFLKVNNVYLTRDDIKYHDQLIRKLYHGDKAIKTAMLKTTKRSQFTPQLALGYEEYSRMTARERAEYMVRVRYVLEAAEDVMAKYYGQQAMNEIRRDFYVKLFALQEAEAAEKRCPNPVNGACPGDVCIVAGYKSVIGGKKSSCGGADEGRRELEKEMKLWGGTGCKSSQVSCNPLVYGFNESGSAFCVDNGGRNSSIYNATRDACPNASPLRKGTPDEAADKKRIIESYLKNQDPALLAALGVNGLTFDKDGKVPKAQYDLILGHLETLNTYIGKASTACQNEPLASIQKKRQEQLNACTALRLRTIELESYPVTTEPPVVPPVEPECKADGSSKENPRGADPFPGGKCDCGAGNEPKEDTVDGKTTWICSAIIAPPPVVGGDDSSDQCNKDQQVNKGDDKDKNQCKKACVWCILGGIGVVGLIIGGVYFATRGGHDNKPTPQQPVDICPPAPLPCIPGGVTPPPTTVTTVPPPIQPPPTTTDPVPTPAVTPFVESTTGTSTSTSGGVR